MNTMNRTDIARLLETAGDRVVRLACDLVTEGTSEEPRYAWSVKYLNGTFRADGRQKEVYSDGSFSTPDEALRNCIATTTIGLILTVNPYEGNFIHADIEITSFNRATQRHEVVKSLALRNGDIWERNLATGALDKLVQPHKNRYDDLPRALSIFR